ncbi:MAG: GntR family transcriptional regulator [Alphaproteobacteria bacterium]
MTVDAALPHGCAERPLQPETPGAGRRDDLSMMLPINRGNIVNGSLHDDIYAALRQALIVGDLVPGQAFSIRTLAERFGTSLIPVRDALKRLVAERGLAMLPNRTLCVPRMTRQRFQELLQVRLSLETMLARRATEFIGVEAIQELDGINGEMQDAVPKDDVKRYLIANQRFHFGLYGAARSAVTFPIVESLWMQVGPFLNGVFTSVGTRHARDNHTEVLKALRRRDAVAVGSAIGGDLADAADVVLAHTEFVMDEV